MQNTLLVTLIENREARSYVASLVSGARVDLGIRKSSMYLEGRGGSLLIDGAKPMKFVVPGHERAMAGPLLLDVSQDHLIGVSDASGYGATAFVRLYEEGMASFVMLRLSDESAWTIGRDEACEISYRSPLVSARHARLKLQGDVLMLTDLRSGNKTLVNDRVIDPLQPYGLYPGDRVQILGLIIVVGKGYIAINKPPQVVFSPALSQSLSLRESPVVGKCGSGQVERPWFYPAPSLKTGIHPLTLTVDAPPPQEERPQMSALAQLGPSFLMGISAAFMAAQAAKSMAQAASPLDAAPALVMALTMVVSSAVWPVATRVWERKAAQRRELTRSVRYLTYLDRVEESMCAAAREQEVILRSTLPPVSDLLIWAKDRDGRLMSRPSGQEGFMCLRVGRGTRPVHADIRWPERHFSLESDKLLDALDNLRANPPELKSVPLALDFVERSVCGVVGDKDFAWGYVRGLLAQICAYYSYHEVKIALFAEEQDRSEWEFLNSLAHFYDECGRERYVALGEQGMLRLGRILEQALHERDSVRMQDEIRPHYVVVCADRRHFMGSHVLRDIAARGEGLGFTLIIMGEDIGELPRECSFIIELGRGDLGHVGLDGAVEAHMFARSDVVGTTEAFVPDIQLSRGRARQFGLDLARLRLRDDATRAELPQTLGFLELLGSPDAEGLCIAARWEANDAARAVYACLGLADNGAPVYLDLHERAHGPHGLVAGTTGSGKSELLMTLVLSLCVNYPPDEVSFLLIDYKGGGLAGAFDNERVRLPHVAGTITNLDGGQVWRALVSLRSELERRQRLLRRACALTGEASMDVYRYLSLWRQGALKEPMPHLVVVADEFAELKHQEPAFMDELISAARIGRSLGVHLLLATQKPSGVVNDQIWSNAHFKVALRVADAADSREVLKRDDAAYLTCPGRFLLSVGYDELFVCGQAAYAGLAYEPSDEAASRAGETVELLDLEGELVGDLGLPKSKAASRLTQLDAVVEAVVAAAGRCGSHAAPLWLAPLPVRLTLDELRGRAKDLYRYVSTGSQGDEDEGTPGRGLSCLMGLVDDPFHQRQFCLDVDFCEAGNIALFGAGLEQVERIAQAMLMDLVETSAHRGLWIYIVDGGSGRLAAFAGLGQVGGVVRDVGADTWRLMRATLDRELDLRRKGGSESRPHLVLAVSNPEALFEADELAVDWLSTFTREGPRLGMHALLCCDGPRGLPYRSRAAFGLQIPTVLGSESDYQEVLGTLGGIALPRIAGHGLVRVGDDVLEFVGATLGFTKAEADDVVRAFDEGLVCAGVPPAPKVPQLPARVVPADIGRPDADGHLALGLCLEDGLPRYVDLAKDRRMVVTGNDEDALRSHLVALGTWYQHTGLGTCCLVDLGGSGLEDDVASVCDVEGLARLIEYAPEAGPSPDLVLVVRADRVLELCPQKLRQAWEELLAGGKPGGPAIVIACPYWTIMSCYDDWLRVALLNGCGLWLGGGFDTQTLLHYTHAPSGGCRSQAEGDGYLVKHGEVVALRALQGEVKSDAGQGEDGRIGSRIPDGV